VELARLARLSFFQGMPQWALIRLAEVRTHPQRDGDGRAACERPQPRTSTPTTFRPARAHRQFGVLRPP
jgi:hypothetical protein